MAKGDIVLITFPFTDLSGSKLRPAVVLVDTPSDVTVCFITTQLGWPEPTDVLLQPNPNNGLRKASLIKTNKIATLDRVLAKGLLGKLSQADTTDLNAKLKTLLQLP
jgi:mRNA interferase MazF